MTTTRDDRQSDAVRADGRAIAVVGAGVMGLVAARTAQRAGASITLFDDGRAGASAVAGAMLAPHAEIEALHPDDRASAEVAFDAWRALLAETDDPDCLRGGGSLLLAHARDRAELERFRKLLRRGERADCARSLDCDGLRALEPGLAERFSGALHLPAEGCADARRVLAALRRALHRDGAAIVEARADPAPDGIVRWIDGTRRFDAIFDCRGMAAREDLRGLRGVRGETVLLHSREVHVARTVRLMHPRWPLYIAPQGAGRFVIGASQIETADDGPMRVRSALELLSAAYAVDPAFGEAEILALQVGVRPAFSDHRPRLTPAGRILRINGLYRHGFLLAPALSRQALAWLAAAQTA